MQSALRSTMTAMLGLFCTSPAADQFVHYTSAHVMFSLEDQHVIASGCSGHKATQMSPLPLLSDGMVIIRAVVRLAAHHEIQPDCVADSLAQCCIHVCHGLPHLIRCFLCLHILHVAPPPAHSTWGSNACQEHAWHDPLRQGTYSCIDMTCIRHDKTGCIQGMWGCKCMHQMLTRWCGTFRFRGHMQTP